MCYMINMKAIEPVLVIQILFFVFCGVLLPIAMICMGSIYMYECPREYLIPIYIVIFGCTYLLANIFYMLSLTDMMGWIAITIIFVLFNIAWLIAGSVWVFGAYHDFDKKRKTYKTREGSTVSPPDNESRYCNPEFYLFSFVVTIVMYVLPVLQLLIYITALSVKQSKEQKAASREAARSESPDVGKQSSAEVVEAASDEELLKSPPPAKVQKSLSPAEVRKSPYKEAVKDPSAEVLKSPSGEVDTGETVTE